MAKSKYKTNTRVIGLVDDDKSMLETLEKDLLEDGSRQAFIAPNSNEVYSWIMNDQVDLLACDLHLGMNKKNGFEVLKECHKINEKLPLILFSRGDIDKKMKTKCDQLKITFLDKAKGNEFISSSIINKLQENPYEKIYSHRKNNPIREKEVEIEKINNEFLEIISNELISELKRYSAKGQIKNIRYLGGKPNQSLDELIQEVDNKTELGNSLIKTYFDLKITKKKIRDNKKWKWF